MIYWTTSLLPMIHPIVVHFPFVLATLAVGSDLLSRRQLHSESFVRAGWILLRLLILSMFLADGTGFLATALLHIPANLNRDIAWIIFFALSATAAGMLAWLLRRRRRWPAKIPPPPNWPSSAALWAAWILLAMGDHVGYVLVYHYGLGTATGIVPERSIGIPGFWLALVLVVTVFLALTGFWWRWGAGRGKRVVRNALGRLLELQGKGSSKNS